MSDSGLLSVLSNDSISSASVAADHLETLFVFGEQGELENPESVAFSASSAELIAMRLNAAGDPSAIEASQEAFDIVRSVIRDRSSASTRTLGEARRLRTRAACLGVLGDLRSQTRQILDALDEELDQDGDDWGQRVELTTLAVWQLLIRKDGWRDLDESISLINQLRNDQSRREPAFLDGEADQRAAWRLVSSYHSPTSWRDHRRVHESRLRRRQV